MVELNENEEENNSNPVKQQEEDVFKAEDIKKPAYIGFRFIEGLCIAVCIFGVLWEGTELMDLSLPQFMIVYGGMGAVITEIMSRITMNSIQKKNKKEGD